MARMASTRRAPSRKRQADRENFPGTQEEMKEQKPNTEADIAETKTVYLTQSAPVMVASIVHLLDHVYTLRKQKRNQDSIRILQKVRRIIFNGIASFGPNFPGACFNGTFYSSLHNIDSILFLCHEIEDGTVLHFDVSSTVMDMIKDLSILAKSWYDFVQEGSLDPGASDPAFEGDEALKRWHESFKQFQACKTRLEARKNRSGTDQENTTSD